MRESIVITGASGWLGQFVYKKLEESGLYDVYGLYNKRIPNWIPETHRFCVDLTNTYDIRSVLPKLNPRVIIHLAAVSAPTACEKDPINAKHVNAPFALVDIVKEISPNTLFIYTSTDLVFDGEKGLPYTVEDSAVPATIYGATKLEFERYVMSLKYGIVLRLSNLIGPKFVYENVGCKFMQFLYESFKCKSYTGLRYDEIRSFVYVEDVTQLMFQIMQLYFNDTLEGVLSQNPSKDYGNIFHVGSPSGLSRLDLGAIMIEALNARSIGASTIYSIVIDEIQDSSKETEEASNVWRVYRVSNLSGVEATGIRNPRDVTMDCTLTETLFNFKFTPMKTAMESTLEFFSPDA